MALFEGYKSDAEMEQYKHELPIVDEAIMKYARAACKEVSARVLQLPRELRDEIYLYLCAFRRYDEYSPAAILGKTSYTFGYRTVNLAVPYAKARYSISSCACLQGVPLFLDPGVMERQAALEALEVYQKETGKRVEGGFHERYLIHWEDVEVFATRDVLHLGLTLHEIFTNHHLTIHIGCLDDIGGDSTLDIIGIPRTAGRLNKLISALYLLSKQKPRPVTFALQDKVTRTPSNLEYVLRKLRGPFHQLRESGFQIGVTYDNDGFTHRRQCCFLEKWTLGDDGWDNCNTKAVWSWTLHQWNLNFTRCHEDYYPKCGMGESFFYRPNGPIRKYFSDPLSGRMEVWESIRRYLYRAYPEVEEAIVLVEGSDGKMYVDCGCPAERHTCSYYYLCGRHTGWDRDSGGKNEYCYKCLEASV